jgi:hypothetical protein
VERLAYALVHHSQGVCSHEQPLRECSGGMVRKQYTPDTRKDVRITGKPAAHIETGAKGNDLIGGSVRGHNHTRGGSKT